MTLRTTFQDPVWVSKQTAGGKENNDDKLGLSLARLKFSLVTVVKVKVTVGVHYLSGWVVGVWVLDFTK